MFSKIVTYLADTNLEKLKKVLAKMLLKSYTNEVASSGGHRISL